ncbi:MAG TPA: hypothetical protein VFN74_14995 [Chloroflexota bacterium]|nr:hypothetical protein [Chloroflexota bacterium]
MLYRVASLEAARGTPLVVEKSVFAPSPAVWKAWRVGTVTTQRFRREFVHELRGRFRADPTPWVDLCEQAALEDVWLVGEPTVTEVLKDCVTRVAAKRGLAVDPQEELDDLGGTLLESTRRKVLEAEGVPMKTDVERMGEVALSKERQRYR